MKIIRGVSEFRDYRASLSGSVGVVPTMGALHDGHLSLAKACREQCDHAIVTVYVNPLQFAPNEDFDAYPRDLEKDCALLEEASIDCVFAPHSLSEAGADTLVLPGDLATLWCGENRPTHFKGVLTVITKLFNVVQPSDAWFGQKDFQQYRIIEKWVEDMLVPVTLHRYPIVREKNGLAISSRNAYLSLEEKQQSLNLYKSMQLVNTLFKSGENSSKTLVKEIKRVLKAGKIDYVAFVDPKSLKPVETVIWGTVLLLAVKIGRTRLIDNMVIGDSPSA